MDECECLVKEETVSEDVVVETVDVILVLPLAFVPLPPLLLTLLSRSSCDGIFAEKRRNAFWIFFLDTVDADAIAGGFKLKALLCSICTEQTSAINVKGNSGGIFDGCDPNLSSVLPAVVVSFNIMIVKDRSFFWIC